MRSSQFLLALGLSASFVIGVPALVLPALADVDGPWSRAYGPTVTTGPILIYDSDGDQLIKVGGSMTSGGGTSGPTWRLGLTAGSCWTTLENPGSENFFYHGSGCYDAPRHRMVVITNSANGPQVWINDLGNAAGWIQVATTGGGIGNVLYGTPAVYDSAGDRLIVIAPGDTYEDTWTLSLATFQWTLLATMGAPQRRLAPSWVYDPTRRQATMFGGAIAGMSLTNEVWQLSLDDLTWTRLGVSGPLPSGGFQAPAMYDPVSDRMIVVIGDTMWSLSLSSYTWTSLLQPPIPGSPVYDGLRGRMLLWGGRGLWAYALTGPEQWTCIGPEGETPTPRNGHTAVYDPLRNQMIVFGGEVPGTDLLNDLWLLHLDAPRHWERLTPPGLAPSPRHLHSAVWDADTRRMIVFGGYDGSQLHRNDVWQLDLSSDAPTWSQISPTGTPPQPRRLQSAAWIPSQRRLRVFGGQLASGSELNDVWDLDLSATPHWSPVVTSGTPPQKRAWHTAIYDPSGDRMIVYAGRDSTFQPLGDVWALSSDGVWSSITPAGAPPLKRYGHTAIYDPIVSRMIVLSGVLGSGTPAFPDCWALDLSGPVAWSLVGGGGDYGEWNLSAHSAVYDAVDRQMIAFGSALVGPYQLQLQRVLGVPNSPAETGGSLALAVGPLPCRDAAWTRFELPTSGRTRLALFDLAGRRRAALVDDDLAPGPHEVRWNADRLSLVSGVYWLRLEQNGRVAAKAVVVAR